MGSRKNRCSRRKLNAALRGMEEALKEYRRVRAKGNKEIMKILDECKLIRSKRN